MMTLMPNAKGDSNYQQENIQFQASLFTLLLLSNPIFEPAIIPYFIFDLDLPEGYDSFEDRDQHVRHEQKNLYKKTKKRNRRTTNKRQSGKYQGR